MRHQAYSILPQCIYPRLLWCIRVVFLFTAMHVKSLAFCVWEWRRYTILYNITLVSYVHDGTIKSHILFWKTEKNHQSIRCVPVYETLQNMNGIIKVSSPCAQITFLLCLATNMGSLHWRKMRFHTCKVLIFPSSPCLGIEDLEFLYFIFIYILDISAKSSNWIRGLSL